MVMDVNCVSPEKIVNEVGWMGVERGVISTVEGYGGDVPGGVKYNRMAEERTGGEDCGEQLKRQQWAQVGLEREYEWLKLMAGQMKRGSQNIGSDEERVKDTIHVMGWRKLVKVQK